MKQRFSSLDITVIAHELSQSLCSLRVSNVYDLSSRIFLIKFHKPDHREQLVIESGFRCHLTQYARTTATEPTNFVNRLRKVLRTRRVNSVAQVGTDRIVELQFSDGQYRLFLEFYAAGNIILTDSKLTIIALLRNVNEGEEHERLRVGLQYDLSSRQNYEGVPPLTRERVREGISKALGKQQRDAAKGKKPKSKTKDALRKAVAGSISEFPPFLVDHALQTTNFDPQTPPEEVLNNEDVLSKLLIALEEAKKIVREVTSAPIAKGYIIAKHRQAKLPEEIPISEAGSTASSSRREDLLYDDFHAFKPRQLEADDTLTFLEFDGYNKTVDEFFSSLEGQKLENRLSEQETKAQKKLNLARQEHSKRIGSLQDAQQLNVRKAEAILANVERVREATDAINGLITKGMDWGDIALMIEREQKQNNPVATMIKLPLKLYENTVTMLLAEPKYDEDDEGYETNSTETESSESEAEVAGGSKKKKGGKVIDQRLAIDVDLGQSPWANAGAYHDQKRSAAVKQEKTLQALSTAMKSTETKVAAELKKGLQQEKEVLRPIRKQFWFEKFYYFISSDGYLVIGGKDALQNDILYNRHLKRGDIYVHADLDGAVPLVIKNRTASPDAPIPPSTLSQAGQLTVSTSSAWESKAVMSAWWVNSGQVSKTAPTGDYLSVGRFNISGEKNYLPPAQLLLGFGVFFQISEDSKARHTKHRVVDQTPPEKADDAGLLSHDTDDADGAGRDDAQEDDSDEDFPDAKLGLDTIDSDTEKSDDEARHNPLDTGIRNAGTGGNQTSDEEVLRPPVDGAEHADESDPPDSLNVQTGGKSGHKHLSAKERRHLKTNEQPGPDPEAASSQPESNDEETAPVNDQASNADSTTVRESQNKKPLPRGKRSKAKRLAAKYADQDEEDRALAMRLLGSRGSEVTSEKGDETQKSREEEAMAQKQRRKEQHLRAQAVGRAAEEARRAANAGEAVESGEVTEEITRLEEVGIDAFIGRPLQGDELLAAIPVCAPWSALANYKYKQKLQPGTLKKKKAIEEIVGGWTRAMAHPRNMDKSSEDGERIWPAEVELIKGWKEAEIIGIVPVGKVRIVGYTGSGSGGGKGKTKAARGGRGSKKRK